MVDVRPEASSDEYVSIDIFIGVVEVEIRIAIVVWHGGATCIGVICWAGEDGGGKDKECGIPTCMGDVESCVLSLVLALFFALAIPCRSRGLG